MPRMDLRLFRGSALSLASQGIGVIQLFALLWRTGATNATDAYFYLFNLGLLPTQILTVGVMYPMMLSDDRLSRPGARRLMLAVPALSIASVLAGSGWLAAAGRVPDSLLPVVVLAAANAAVQAVLWQRAMAAAASGSPEWEAAVALPANLLATAVIAVPLSSSTATVTAMMSALLIGNTGFLLAALYRKAGRPALDGLPEERTARRGTHWWFLGKSGTGYGGLMVLQSLAVLLPTSALTFLSIAIKIVGSVAATFVNSVMPKLVHQGTTSPEGGRRFLRLTAATIAPVGVVGVIGVAVVRPDLTLGALVIALWLLASSSAATAQRMAFRFLAPSASRVTLVAVPVVVLLAAGSASRDSFELVTLLCAYAGVDALVGALLLLALRDRLMSAVVGAITGALVTIWVVTLAT
ncbi:hypothetical protein [Nocardioides lianchengensis]|uniref:Membrane protein involved in the export of O-antigen and teichoic acid n=1 Tax=Nocardioides lianchengensis TaxID=1045774 RepID=A0A1G6LTS9_9ACTN|nr:hypothetical protein [Nocardioides lianchengensis]NYG12446.1 hypothetical protein [Nocardioides lianchengensis]SDC46653.1 hypothetical protein SAMN05421872_102358 [Nocardioides lianchengensis]